MFKLRFRYGLIGRPMLFINLGFILVPSCLPAFFSEFWREPVLNMVGIPLGIAFAMAMWLVIVDTLVAAIFITVLRLPRGDRLAHY